MRTETGVLTKSRSKGNGYLFKRGTFYYFEFKINGKRKTVSLKTKNKRDAESKAKEYLPIISAKTKEEIAVYVKQAKKLECQAKAKFVSAWDDYLKHPGRPDSGDGTLKNYEGNFRRFKNWVENSYPVITAMGQITCKISREYAVELYRSGISAKTYNNHVKALHLIFRILLSDSGMEKNPFNKENISRKIEKKQGREKLSTEQIKIVLNSFSNPAQHLMQKEQMEVLFNIGAWTGLRLIDAVHLKWRNIDFKKGLIKCIPVKTQRIQRSVTIPLFPQLRKVFDKATGWKKNEFVIPDVVYRYEYNPHGVKQDCIKIFQFIGLETTYRTKNSVQRLRKANRFGFHSFRHSFASLLAEKGVDIVKLSKILGDNIKTLEKYYISIGDEFISSISIEN